MDVLNDDAAVGRIPVAGEDLAPPRPVTRGRPAGWLRRLAVLLRGDPLEEAGVAERPRAASREGGAHADMDAGLTRGATLLFGAGPTRPRRK